MLRGRKSARRGGSTPAKLRLEPLEHRRLLDAGPYPPAADQPGSTAIHMDDTAFVGWATGYEDLARGPVDIDDPSGTTATFGEAENALGKAVGDSCDAVSLGDGGQISLTFDTPIRNGVGADFAVFENGFSDTFLEIGLVEVSSNGSDFFIFDAVSLTPTDTQVGGFGALDATNLHNLAGKYRQGFGTPFDLAELEGVSPLLDVDRITHVRITDVVGRITAAPGNPSWSPTVDSLGNVINDPYATPFASSGFDLDAVGVINTAAVSFEDVGAELAAESYWNGSDGSGGFTSGGASFNNNYNSEWGTWDGWSYSNTTDTATPGFGNQYSAFPGTGTGDSATYAVGYAGLWTDAPAITLPENSGLGFESIKISNATYTALSMRDGDDFAKKFGGETGDDPDWLMLTISGTDVEGDAVGTVDFYLADYRFTDNQQDYIVDDWATVDLTSLQGATTLDFALSSSDIDPIYGMNTPAYFVADDIALYNPRINDFEDVGASLDPESHYHGAADGEYVFQSGQLEFDHHVSWSGSYWDQWTYSNETDLTTAGYTNQFSAYVLADPRPANTYGIAYSGMSGGYGAGNEITLDAPQGLAFESIDVTNTTYAALSMLGGDDFAREFGWLDANQDEDFDDPGDYTGNYPDWFLLTIDGYSDPGAAGDSVGTVEFYLADYRFEDDALDYVVDDWTTVDLTSLRESASLKFTLTSSDNDPVWGMNTPAYFAADNIEVFEPTLVTLDAGTGNNTITFATTDTQHVITIDGVEHVFERNTRTDFTIIGLEDRESIAVAGTDGDELARLNETELDASGPGYSLHAAGVEVIALSGGGGNDRVSLSGTPASSNRLYSRGDTTTLTDSTRSFSQQVDEFETVTVDASEGRRNYAYLYDSPGDDRLEASPESVVLDRANGLADTTATGFQRVYIYANNGGSDTAQFTGSETAANRFYSHPDYARLTEARQSFYYHASGFESVEATSDSSATSSAYFYDGSGDDTFTATPTQADMDRSGTETHATAVGFQRVYAYATRGGQDTAELTGSDSGNQLRAYPTHSTLTDSARSFYHLARGFDSVTAFGSDADPSGDRAYLYDASGDDLLYGHSDHGYLEDTAGTYHNEFWYFDLVYARSRDSDSSTDDTVDIDDSLVYDLIRSGTW